jgi:hypothetical protein
MTFWSSVLELRKQQKIPRLWSLADLRPYLCHQFSEGTILSTPSGQSISLDGRLMGSLIRRGRKPMAIRVKPGVFTLVNDPDVDLQAGDDAADSQRTCAGSLR